MRYYFEDQDERIVINLARTEKISNFEYVFHFEEVAGQEISKNKKIRVRDIAGKYYRSYDDINWKRIPKQPQPDQILNVDKVYNFFRGYKPSNAGGAAEGALVTQMPGKIIKILVKEGDEIEKGQTLIILEAMKMENEIKAGKDGVVKLVNVSEGDAVESGVTMLEIE